MADRTEILEATLDSLTDGIAIFAEEGEVIFWNLAAQGITGYAAIELQAQPIPEGLAPLLSKQIRNEESRADAEQPEAAER